MKLSLFTPTCDPHYLSEAYDSIRQQAHEDWEWLILLNGGYTTQDGTDQFLPGAAADPRVRFVDYAGDSDNIGALKRAAVRACKGDAFVEFDHDDLLVPGVLGKLDAAFKDGAGFAYSDSAVFEDDLHTWGYHPAHGWETYPVTVYGTTFTATRAFPITPRSLCEVYYAPDHVRAWSRNAYYDAGGHDHRLAAGDDHDLVCRTYLRGIEFRHVGGCGYLYRVHGNNTVKRRSQAIQAVQADNRRKYLPPLIDEWCRREGLSTASLGALKQIGGWDYHQPIPFADESMGRLTANGVLHLVPPERQVAFFNEAYRILRPGGWLCVDVPVGRAADMDPMTRVRFNSASFLWYCRSAYACRMPGVQCRYDDANVHEYYASKEEDELQLPRLRAELCALKGQEPYPGPGPRRV